jgi:hypothetical protein
MGASQLSYGVDPRPPKLEPDRFAPVFVLAPARSHTSVVTTMVGRHPDLADLLELKLFAYPLKDSLPRFWIERWVTHRSGRFAAFAARPCMTGICAKRTLRKPRCLSASGRFRLSQSPWAGASRKICSASERGPLSFPSRLGFLSLFFDRRLGGAEIRPWIGERGEARRRVAGGEIVRPNLG